jgi:hypothetical protein
MLFVDHALDALNDFELALIDAGILRLRRTLITVLVLYLRWFLLQHTAFLRKPALLRTNRRPVGCDRGYEVPGSSDVCNICS